MVRGDEVRDALRAWIEEAWDPERPLREWRNVLADSGWGCPTWPEQWYGRGLTPEQGKVVAEEFEAAGAVGPAIGVGMSLAAPTILDHGSDDIKGRFLRTILTGEDTWCQLFSEPGAGSDLAGLRCRAELTGDEWIVNGQKVWSTGAHKADFGLLLVRTDRDVPKHRGITYLVLPMKQDGVEVRPIRQMNGFESFNEIFITDARVPASNVIGEVNDGWRVAVGTLAHERRSIGSFGQWAALARNASGRTAREAAAEADAYLKTYEWYPARQGRPDLVASHARSVERLDDPIVRQDIARVRSLVVGDRLTKERGASSGAGGSITKLVLSQIAREAAAAHGRIAGPSGVVTGSEGALGGTVAEVTLSFPAQSIAGGTDDVQRNIVGERILGLPKEPAVDRDVPFRDVRG